MSEHRWKWVKDWYGNPDVPYGTVDISHWECVDCDKEAETDDEIQEAIGQNEDDRY